MQPFDDDAMDAVIARNQPSLGSELAARDRRDGRWQHWLRPFLAREIAEKPDARTADLVTPEAIRQFVSQSLADGLGFFSL